MEIPGFIFFFIFPLVLFIGYFAIKSLHEKGWKDLQDRYHFNYEYFNGENLKIRNLKINDINSQNVVKIKASGQGLFIKMTFPFNIFSKPILIPWDDIVDVQSSKVLFYKMKKIIIGNPLISTIELSEKDYNKMRNYISLE